jgi:Putative prokaryotic signal transducing protein
MKPTELVVLSTFRSVADAQIVKGILDEEQIESTIRSDNAGGMYPALDSADLMVRVDDAERAREALERRHSR